MPTVTVVIPVFDGENYLEEAINSVLKQTYRDFEVLIVDDGSTDSTWSIVEAYIAENPTLIRGIRKPNGGTASALNAGIQAAQGKYVAWLSHDDRFMPHKLETQLNLLGDNPEVVGCYSDYILINSMGADIGIIYSTWYPQPLMLRHLLQNVFINGSTLLIERRCFLEVGLFDETVRYAHDALMWAHLVQRYQLTHIPESLIEYRVHPNQGTNKYKAAVRRDNALWLSKVLQSYTVREIFPELNKPQSTAADVAAGYTYFGDVLIIRYRHLTIGLGQYWKGWLAWPNLRNPMLRKVLLSTSRVCKEKTREWIRAARRLRHGPVAEDQPIPRIEVKLRMFCEVVPDIHVSSDK